MIKYLGSKRALLGQIMEQVLNKPEAKTVLDLFSGTARVGHALKQHGFRVTSNDHNAYAATLARCYVEADLEDVEGPARMLIAEFNTLPGHPGYFTETFCERSRFFQPKNGARVDAIRESIASKNLPADLEAVVLVSLMEAADRVDSTCGVQMAYLKQWAARANNDLELRLPKLLSRPRNGKCRVLQADAVDAVKLVESDVLYLDPPYNQHSYLGNYHIWESLVLWDKPEVYGVACKRIDVKERKSAFNSKTNAHEAMRGIIQAAQAKTIIVSMNAEGFISPTSMVSMLEERGTVQTFPVHYKRYVGSQIGVYNPGGDLVGTPGATHTTEFIYVVDASKKP
jgi:adenine-specific DNA-methyltransferase